MFFNLFLIAIFSDISQIQELFPFLAKINFQKLVTAGALIGIFFESNTLDSIKKSLSSRMGKVIIFLFFWMIISVPLSIFPGHSFEFLTEVLWKVIAIFLMILAYGSSKERFDKIIWTYIMALGFLSTLTLVDAGGISRFSVGGGYDPNDTALQFLMAFPFFVWKFRSSTGIMKIVTGAGSIILLIGIVATKSRGGFVGLMAVTAIMIFQMNRTENLGIVKIFLLITVMASIMNYFGGSEYQESISTIFNPSADYNITSDTGRLAIWERGIDILLKNPLQGVGVDNYITADGRLYADVGSRWNTAHNSFIQIGAELGFPGLFAFCFLIWGSIKRTRNIISVSKNVDLNNYRRITAYSIIGSWVGYIVGGFFL